MKYLKLYKNANDYYSDSLDRTEYNDNRVSYLLSDLEKGDAVKYNDYRKIPLTFEVLSAGTVNWTCWGYWEDISSEDIEDGKQPIMYSLNDGEWVSLTLTGEVQTDSDIREAYYLTYGIPVQAGDIVRFKGDVENVGDTYNDFSYTTAYVNLLGNIKSIRKSNGFERENTAKTGEFSGFFSYLPIVLAEKLELPKHLNERCYSYMFSRCTSLTSAPALPATTLASNCYSSMFYGCTSLTSAPVLPATTLADYCYQYMFEDCRNLTRAPELPAKSLSNGCYYNMFLDCTSLTVAPELPATTLADNCYNGTFQNCAGLTSAPELPATTLVNRCYNSMFRGCTSLTNAPKLPAITLYSECYSYMFLGCTSLVIAPELPATNLAYACYYYMFAGCTSLIKAPELPATVLARSCYNHMFGGCTSLTAAPQLPSDNVTSSYRCYYEMFYGCTSLTAAPILCSSNIGNECYKYMFKGCTNLNSITCLATSNDGTATISWVDGVAARGTFTKSPQMSSWANGVNGIPNGWTIEDLSPLMIIYVDDIPDGVNDGYEEPYDPDYVEALYHYPTIEDYLEAYIQVPQGFGGSKYAYYGETLEYDGDTYYLWEFQNTLTNNVYNTRMYCLTETVDFGTLYNLSVESNLSNRNCVIYLINNDGNEYFPQEDANPHENADNLIKVERYVEKTPLLRMWIDDFPDDGSGYDDQWANQFYGYDTMDDYLDDYFSNPETFGSNMFNYYGETIEYDGVTYYLWEFESDSVYWSQGSPLYCVTTTVDYNTLNNISIEVNGIEHQTVPFVYSLQGDLQVYETQQSSEKVLVMVENLQN